MFSVDITGNTAEKSPGSIVSSGQAGIEIACADYSVIIKEVQAQNGKRMSAVDYLRGNPIKSGSHAQ